MINDGQLKEFGFDRIDKFPQLLNHHAVTVSLPSAIAHQVKPVTVVIEKGLAIPVQMPGVSNGMIIKNDGTMVFVSHEKQGDFQSALKASFTKEISYDVRGEAYNIMRRAVEVDSKLKPVWLEIEQRWQRWYPPDGGEVKRQSLGSFQSIGDALLSLEGLIEKFMGEVKQQTGQLDAVPLRVIVQTQEELAKGWQGEEFLVDELFAAFDPKKLRQQLKRVLMMPVFSAVSTFQLYYEPRVVPVAKLVVVPPQDQGSADGYGIDLD